MYVVDIIKSRGPIVFRHGRIFHPAQLLQIEKLGEPIAKFENGAYSMEAGIKGRPDAEKEQTDTHRNWVKYAKSAHASRPAGKRQTKTKKKPSCPKLCLQFKKPNTYA